MAVVDAWSEAVRRASLPQEPEKNKNGLDLEPVESEQEQDMKLYTILAGPTTLTAASDMTACVQFGVANAVTLKDAPAGLLEVSVRAGL